MNEKSIGLNNNTITMDVVTKLYPSQFESAAKEKDPNSDYKDSIFSPLLSWIWKNLQLNGKEKFREICLFF